MDIKEEISKIYDILQKQRDEIDLLKVEMQQVRATFKCCRCGSRITEEDVSLYKCNGCAAEKCL